MAGTTTATQTKAVRGLNVLIKIGTEIVGGQRGASLTRQVETIDITNKSTGTGWKEFLHGVKEWGLNCDGIVVLEDAGYKALKTAFNADEYVDLKLTDDHGYGYEGKAIISSFPEDAPYNDAVKYSLQFIGSGALTEIPVTPPR